MGLTPMASRPVMRMGTVRENRQIEARHMPEAIFKFDCAGTAVSQNAWQVLERVRMT